MQVKIMDSKRIDDNNPIKKLLDLIDDNDPIKQLVDENNLEAYIGADLNSIGNVFEDIQREQERRDRLRDDSDYRKVHEMMMEDEDYRNEQAKRDRAYEAHIQNAKIMKEKLEKNLRNKNGDNLP